MNLGIKKVMDFMFWKPKPNSHLYGLEFRNDEEHKEKLLCALTIRFGAIVEKFCKMVENYDYLNPTTIKGAERNLSIMFINLKNMQESLLYLSKYSDIKSDGRIFGLRLRIDKFIRTLNSYRFQLKYYSPHKDALEYFKFKPIVSCGFVYGIDTNVKIINILNKYRELYKLKIENGEFEDVY